MSYKKNEIALTCYCCCYCYILLQSLLKTNSKKSNVLLLGFFFTVFSFYLFSLFNSVLHSRPESAPLHMHFDVNSSVSSRHVAWWGNIRDGAFRGTGALGRLNNGSVETLQGLRSWTKKKILPLLSTAACNIRETFVWFLCNTIRLIHLVMVFTETEKALKVYPYLG